MQRARRGFIHLRNAGYESLIFSPIYLPRLYKTADTNFSRFYVPVPEWVQKSGGTDLQVDNVTVTFDSQRKMVRVAKGCGDRGTKYSEYDDSVRAKSIYETINF